MRSLGMTPVFPAFAGFVPEALARERPAAHISRSDNWCSFPDRFCCVHLLDPLEPLFREIGGAFIKAQNCPPHPARFRLSIFLQGSFACTSSHQLLL